MWPGGYLCYMEWQYELHDINVVAQEFRDKMARAKIFAIHGAMGSGKTTFIHAVCDALKVSSTVGSPTFSIINQYEFPAGIIYHIDLYRLKDEEEAIRAGIEDCLYSDNYCLVEWPEKAPHIFPDDTVHVFIEALNGQSRLIRIPDK